MIKQVELSDPNSCINKAADNEPVFVLRAQDEIAPAVVRWWAWRAQRLAHLPEAKFNEAMALADAMEQWPTRKLPD